MGLRGLNTYKIVPCRFILQNDLLKEIEFTNG